jgi:hypothetical protein
MKTVCLLVLAAFFLTAGASQLPFLETFDELTNNVSINNQHGWVVDSGTSATVQSSVVATNSSQALEIQNSQVTHSLSNSKTSIWISFQARITAKPDANPIVSDANTSVAFFVNTNGSLVVYSNTTPVTLNTIIPTNVWTRFDVYCDYSNLKWMLSINGTNVASDLALYSASSQVESLLIANHSTNAAYIDELAVQDTEPANGLADSDGDGIPDWWEMSHTNAAPNGIAQNGMTYLQNYIAGLDPSNASDVFRAIQGDGRKISWDRKDGRQYDIYWTSNLMSEFSFIYTAPGSVFEDTDIARTGNPAGFYQIRVHK